MKPRDRTLTDASAATAAVLMVDGVRTVGGGLYERVAGELSEAGVIALHVRLERPGDLDAATAEVRAAVDNLAGRGVERVVLVGHAFAGAAVIRAGTRDERVTAVCTLSAQGNGTADAALLAPRALLAIHGTHDAVAAASCSGDLVRMAGENARLELIDGAGHSLDVQTERVHDLVSRWLRDQVG